MSFNSSYKLNNWNKIYWFFRILLVIPLFIAAIVLSLVLNICRWINDKIIIKTIYHVARLYFRFANEISISILDSRNHLDRLLSNAIIWTAPIKEIRAEVKRRLTNDKRLPKERRSRDDNRSPDDME